MRHAIRHFGQLSVSRFTVVYTDNNVGRSLSAVIRAQPDDFRTKPVPEFAIPLSLAGLRTVARNVLRGKPQVNLRKSGTMLQ